jgi:hypothetical protein
VLFSPILGRLVIIVGSHQAFACFDVADADFGVSRIVRAAIAAASAQSPHGITIAW